MHTAQRKPSQSNSAPPKESARSALASPLPAVVSAPRAGSCACGGGCPRCRNKSGADRAPPIVHDVLRTPGAPLAEDVQAQMEERFGRNLNHVRIHADHQAAQSARAVGAAAYTVGSHVAFDSGRYAPHTASGRRTLAHELTHVLQQRGASPDSALRIGPSGDAAEQEADRVAASVVSGAAAPVQVRAHSSMQMLRRQDYGVDGAIRSGHMTPVPGVHDTLFSAQDCFGRPGCSVDFMFQHAYTGTYETGAGGRTLRAARVTIHANHTAECGTCDTLEVVQVLRDISHDASGATVLREPSDAPLPSGTAMTPELERMYRARHLRSGWDDPHAPSRGWRVDAATPRDTAPGYDSTDPFYTHTPAGRAGTGGHDAVIQDTPTNFDTDTNVGRDFQTCLICTRGGARSVLGCLTWGMYIDALGQVSIQPLPAVTCGTTMELADATTRWQGISGNQPTSLSSRAPR
jgi:hypothetical protein